MRSAEAQDLNFATKSVLGSVLNTNKRLRHGRGAVFQCHIFVSDKTEKHWSTGTSRIGRRHNENTGSHECRRNVSDKTETVEHLPEDLKLFEPKCVMSTMLLDIMHTAVNAPLC